MQMGDLALRKSDDLHIRIRHAFEEAGDILLIA